MQVAQSQPLPDRDMHTGSIYDLIEDTWGYRERLLFARTLRKSTCAAHCARQLGIRTTTVLSAARAMQMRIPEPTGVSGDLCDGTAEPLSEGASLVDRIDGRLPLALREQAMRSLRKKSARPDTRLPEVEPLPQGPLPTVPVLTVRALVRLAGRFYAVSEDSIWGETRKNPAMQARLAVYIAAKDIVKMSSMQIGARMGRDHSTVLNALKKPRDDFQPFLDHVMEQMP